MLEACFRSERIGVMMLETFQQTADNMWRLLIVPRLMNKLVARTELLEEIVDYAALRVL